jgi:hypothetical protein
MKDQPQKRGHFYPGLTQSAMEVLRAKALRYIVRFAREIVRATANGFLTGSA